MRMLIAAMLMTFVSSFANAEDKAVYELQCFTLREGTGAKYEQLVKTAGLDAVKKVDVKLLGAWKPTNAADERLILLFSHASKENATMAWDAVKADADWIQANSQFTQANGNVVTGFKRIYLDPLSFGNNLESLLKKDSGSNTYELRTYVTSPGNLKNLYNRFSNHTVKLFEKHGMTNVIYWSVDKNDSVTDANLIKALAPAGAAMPDLNPPTVAHENMLVYFLAHQSEEAGKASFNKFRVDPTWKSALEASEKNAGGSLTVPKGVFSLYLTPCEFSPLK